MQKSKTNSRLYYMNSSILNMLLSFYPEGRGLGWVALIIMSTLKRTQHHHMLCSEFKMSHMIMYKAKLSITSCTTTKNEHGLYLAHSLPQECQAAAELWLSMTSLPSRRT
jgi:hypothetical protein